MPIRLLEGLDAGLAEDAARIEERTLADAIRAFRLSDVSGEALRVALAARLGRLPSERATRRASDAVRATRSVIPLAVERARRASLPQ